MASGTVYDAVKSHLQTNWTATPLAFENEDKDASGNAVPPNPAVTFVAIEMTGTMYGQQSIGAETQAANRWDEEGVLWLHVVTPKGQGASEARHHAKNLADLFRGTTLLSGDLEFLDAAIGMGEPADADGNWWRISVSVEWRRMEA